MCVPLLDKHRVTPEKRMGVCHTHCVALYVNNGGKHTDDDLDRVGSPPDFGKSLGVGWETWLMIIMTRSVFVNFDCRMHEKV